MIRHQRLLPSRDARINAFQAYFYAARYNACTDLLKHPLSQKVIKKHTNGEPILTWLQTHFRHKIIDVLGPKLQCFLEVKDDLLNKLNIDTLTRYIIVNVY